MAAQLDILALEPFYGGPRRAMLSAIRRCSRHRWTILKLPPRRMERRLAAAANWFAEQLCRHFTGDIDVLFTSEAMNLANLLRLVPELAKRPSVVYFHDNHLPEVGCTRDGPFDLINLTTALSATEIWFNSTYHLRTFLARAQGLVARHPELTATDPMRSVSSRAFILPPPTDLNFTSEVRAYRQPLRDPDTIFVETRNADVKLLNSALEILWPRRNFKLVTVGPVDRLSEKWPRSTVREADEVAQVLGMLESGVFLSVKPVANFDYLFVRAMLAGCRPLVPSTGMYHELIPQPLQEASLFTPTPESLAAKLEVALCDTRFSRQPPDWRKPFATLDAIVAARQIDERLEQMARARISAA
jgi:uncharacterized protein DUF3524